MTYINKWLRLGAPHHFALNLGDHVRRWRHVAELLDLEYEEI